MTESDTFSTERSTAVSGITDVAKAADGAEQPWLSPASALSRYTPAKDTSTGGSRPAIRQVRYGFRVGDIGLVIDRNKASEIVDDVPVRAIPNTPLWLSGLINLRGNLVPVFDLKALFGIAREQSEKRWMLIVDKGDKAIALPVEGLPRIVDIGQRSAQLPPTPEPLRPHVHAAYVDRGEVWVDFDFEGLFKALGAQIAG